MTDPKRDFHDLLDLRVGKGIANGTLTLYFEDVGEDDMDKVISLYRGFRKDILTLFGKTGDIALPKKLHRDLSEFVPDTDHVHPQESKARRHWEKSEAKVVLKPVAEALDDAAIVGGEPCGGEIVVGGYVQQLKPFQNGEKFFGKLKVEKIDKTLGEILVVVKKGDTSKKYWKPMKYFGATK